MAVYLSPATEDETIRKRALQAAGLVCAFDPQGLREGDVAHALAAALDGPCAPALRAQALVTLLDLVEAAGTCKVRLGGAQGGPEGGADAASCRMTPRRAC